MGPRQQYFDIISGRNRSVPASLVRFVLSCLTPVYFCLWWLRNRKYNKQGAPIYHAGVPTISVGNLTTGGTGKTPLVLWLSEFIQKNNCRPVILSRGYGSPTKLPNDEFRELKLRAPSVEHLQDPDRSKIAQLAIDQFSADVLILDDGFQHRRLARDLDIVVVDATDPFGFEFLLPRGLLREPKSSLSRADIVICSRYDQIDEANRQALVAEIKKLNPHAALATTRIQLSALVDRQTQSRPLNHLTGKRVAAFAGIGNPQNFIRSLAGSSMEVAMQKWFADHYDFQPTDLRSLQNLAAENNCVALVCTLKDLVKIDPAWNIDLPLFAAVADLQFIDGRDMVEEKILDLLHNRITKK